MLTRTLAKTLDAKRYAETFAVFVNRSHEYPAMLDRLSGFAKTLPVGFSICDIGAGTGMVVRDWLGRGGPQPGRYTAIEPNPSHAASLREAVAGFEFETDVIEAPFHRDYDTLGRHDLVLFSHSLYWMPDPVACVRRANEALTADGLVVAFLQSPLGVYSMATLFEPLLDRDRPPGPNHRFSSHELVHGLRAAGLNPHVDYDPTPLDLTDLFDTGRQSELNEFISFCLQLEAGELAEPLKSDIVDYLRNAAVEQGGRLLWFEPNATVTVQSGR